MIEWKFYIDDVQYEEPNSFTDLILGLKRDEAYHGVFFEASIGVLEFTGRAADYITEKEQTEGIQANIIFRAEIRCDENGLFEELISGKLNMSKLDRECGKVCTVKVPIEQSDCTMLLRNRFDQKVDLDSLLAFDKITALEAYPLMGSSVTMPSKALQVGAEGSVDADGDTIDFTIFPDAFFVSSYLRPTYANKIDESINRTELEPSVWAASSDVFSDSVVSPVVLIDETIDCFAGLFDYSFRFKGDLTIYFGMAITFRVMKGTLPDIPKPFSQEGRDLMTILHEQSLDFSTSPYSTDFDLSFAGSTALESGEGLWGYVQIDQQTRQGSDANHLTFDAETSVSVTALRECPITDSVTYPIHESLSRVVEAISNGCLKVRSDYYGRTDSRPYAASEDGCGSLRVINSGLQLRNAEEAKLFLSFKDAMEGLNPIDNIGFGIEADPDRPGFDQVRIEEVRHFYQEEEVLQLPLAPSVRITIIESEHYANIKVGFQKWEVQQVKGLDEVNANREFRTSLTSVTNTLTILSKFVGGSYAAEVTRQQSFAATGGADTTYDNETFIFCVTRAAYGFTIEQGGITSAANIFSPATLFNWKIRPWYNLMRWFKTIAAGYANVGDTEKKLFFTAGTANYLAEGEQTDLSCKLENGVKAENDEMGRDDFLTDEYLPIWRPKSITLRYPLSVGEYKRIKAKPYGYISVQCGTGEWLQGYINSVQYSPTKGEADFILKMRWLPTT